MLRVRWNLSRNCSLVELDGPLHVAAWLPHSMVSELQGLGFMHQKLRESENEREIESCIIFYTLDSVATQCYCN